MRRYILDSGPLAAYLFGRPTARELITPWVERQEAATSILSYAEVVEYLKGLPRLPERQAELRQLLQVVYPFALTYRILERYADLRRSLRRPYGLGLIGDIDTLIAATAIERNLMLVTTDHDFDRVPGLVSMIVDFRS